MKRVRSIPHGNDSVPRAKSFPNFTPNKTLQTSALKQSVPTPLPQFLMVPGAPAIKQTRGLPTSTTPINPKPLTNNQKKFLQKETAILANYKKNTTTIITKKPSAFNKVKLTLKNLFRIGKPKINSSIPITTKKTSVARNRSNANTSFYASPAIKKLTPVTNYNANLAKFLANTRG